MPFVFIAYPIRLSRFCCFLVCLTAGIYSLALTIHSLYYISVPDRRPRYAVTWRTSPNTCYCGCTYPVNQTICIRYFVIGVLSLVKSLFVAFRCLKGLRRSNWASLLSVMFPIPVNAYSVEWTTPKGLPIRHRKQDEPIQSELAFDPFALMDEQPESKSTQVSLRPEFVFEEYFDGTCRRWRRTTKRNLLGPIQSLPDAGSKIDRLKKNSDGKEVTVQKFEYIGCCGFPCTTGGIQGRLSGMSDSDSEEEEYCASPTASARGLRGSGSSASPRQFS